MAEQTLQDGVAVRAAWGRNNLRWGVALGVVCLSAGGAICRWLLQIPTQQVIQLPDGHTVRLLSTTYGTNQRCLEGPRWQQLLLPLLGVRRARDWGWRATEFSRPKPTLVYWFAESRSNRGSGRPIMQRVVNERHSSIPGMSYSGIGGGDDTPSALVLEKFPRRGRYVYLDYQAYEDFSLRNGRRVGRLVALNPTPGPHPQWKPLPIPQTVRAGNIAFTLKQFLVGVADPKDNRAAADPDFGGSVLTFEALENGEVNTVWRPVTASFANATGDSWPDSAWGDGAIPGKLWTVWSLGTEEAAWKIGVRFARTGGFTPAETWEFRDVPLPPPGPTVFVDRLLERGETRVRLRSLALRRNTPKRWELRHELQISPQPPGSYVSLVGIRDERGRDLSRFGENARQVAQRGTFPASGDRGFALDVPAGTHRVSLTLALHRSKYVTFLAAPQLAGAQAATPAAAR